MSNPFVHLELSTSDTAKAKQFYSGLFGWEFTDNDMGGGMKALWVIFVIILPFLGVLVYLIARGGKMHERAAEQAERGELPAHWASSTGLVVARASTPCCAVSAAA